MREILFRAKRLHKDEWVEGFYKEEKDFDKITRSYVGGYEVQEETVGQYTGVLDKHGTKVFEGDILRDRCGAIAQLIYRIEKMSYALKSPHTGENEFAKCKHMNELEVIGNIHDNEVLSIKKIIWQRLRD